MWYNDHGGDHGVNQWMLILIVILIILFFFATKSYMKINIIFTSDFYLLFSITLILICFSRFKVQILKCTSGFNIIILDLLVLLFFSFKESKKNRFFLVLKYFSPKDHFNRINLFNVFIVWQFCLTFLSLLIDKLLFSVRRVFFWDGGERGLYSGHSCPTLAFSFPLRLSPHYGLAVFRTRSPSFLEDDGTDYLIVTAYPYTAYHSENLSFLFRLHETMKHCMETCVHHGPAIGAPYIMTDRAITAYTRRHPALLVHQCWPLYQCGPVPQPFTKPSGGEGENDPGRSTASPKLVPGRTFAISMRTEHRDQASFCPFVLHEVSVFTELALGHLRYTLTDVPPQSNSPPGSVLESDHAGISSAIGRGLTPF
ncbi:RRT15 protein, partial [Acromyrmex insinuator]